MIRRFGGVEAVVSSPRCRGILSLSSPPFPFLRCSLLCQCPASAFQDTRRARHICVNHFNPRAPVLREVASRPLLLNQVLSLMDLIQQIVQGAKDVWIVRVRMNFYWERLVDSFFAPRSLQFTSGTCIASEVTKRAYSLYMQSRR